MTNEENKLIESVKKGVLRKFPLLGATMSNMEFVSAENMGVDTCATDGEKVFYSKKFLNNLSEQERVFAVSHELMHVAFDHILRSKGRDMEVWNYATDSVINQMLKSEDIWWNGAFDMKEAVNKSAEEMYNILMEQKKQQQKRQGMQGQNGQNGKPESNQQKGQSQNQSGMDKNGSPNNQGKSGQNNQSPNYGQNIQSQGMNKQGSQMPQNPVQNSQNNGFQNQGQSGLDDQKGTNNQNGQIGNGQGKQSQAERIQNGSNQGQNQQSQNQSGQSGDEDKTQKHQDANSGGQNNVSETGKESGTPNKGNTNGHNSNNSDNLNDNAESETQGENSEINQNSLNKPQQNQNSQSGQGQDGQNQANKLQNNIHQSSGQMGQSIGESGSTELSGNDDKNQQKDGEGLNQASNGANTIQSNEGESIDNENGERETSLNQSDMDLSKFGEMHSTHSMWEEAVKKAEKKEQQSKKSKLSEFINKFKKIDTDTLSKSNETHSSTGKMGTAKSYDTLEKDFIEDNKELKKEIASRIRSRLYSSQGASKDGGNGGGCVENYGYIEQQKAILSWKKLLKSEIESEESRWSYRRADEDNYYQARIGSIYEQNKPIVQVMIDTSGSVSKTMIKQFLAQTKTLLKDCIVFVSCFDTRVYGFSHIKTQNDIDSYTIRGGGGTSFDSALKGFSKDKRVYKIIFTDGEDTVTPTIDVKKMQRVVWLVWKQNSFKPCVGKVIRVDQETLKNTQRDDGLGR